MIDQASTTFQLKIKQALPIRWENLSLNHHSEKLPFFIFTYIKQTLRLSTHRSFNQKIPAILKEIASKEAQNSTSDATVLKLYSAPKLCLNDVILLNSKLAGSKTVSDFFLYSLLLY